MGKGNSKIEAIRCLKRYIAREVFAAYCRPPPLDSRSIGPAWCGETSLNLASTPREEPSKLMVG